MDISPEMLAENDRVLADMAHRDLESANWFYQKIMGHLGRQYNLQPGVDGFDTITGVITRAPRPKDAKHKDGTPEQGSDSSSPTDESGQPSLSGDRTEV